MHINPFVPIADGAYCLVTVPAPREVRDFPAKHERLVTAAELVRYGV